MKFLIFLSLIALSLCTPESECKANPACQECAISWDCNYGNNEKKTEECYEHCMKHAIDFDPHKNVEEAEETTVHKKEEKKAFLEIKQLNTPEKDKCMTNPACEGCAISWSCEYGQKPELVEECYKHCWDNKIDYDVHKAIQAAKEVDVHQ